jgi:hypothetical protein
MMRFGLLYATLVMGLAACGSAMSEANELKFCPANSEEDTRETLDLGSAQELNLDELLMLLDSREVSYELAHTDNIPRKCENFERIPDARTYMIYAGVDASKNFARNYLIVADAAGHVRYIEARHAYRAPKLWSD